MQKNETHIALEIDMERNKPNIRAESIQILGLPIRLENVLNSAGFQTIGDLCENSRDECEAKLMKLRYFVARRRLGELPALLDQLEKLGVWSAVVEGNGGRA